MGLAIALIPLSLWCCDLANDGLPRRLLRAVLGPQVRTQHTSAPDYFEWDIATMLLMAAVCGGSALYLAAQALRSLRKPGNHDP